MSGADRRPRIGRARLWLATSFGVGYAPIVPGTFGSLPGLVLVWALWNLGGQAAVVAGTLVVTVAGLWAADGGARHFGGGDPRPVVIDEVAGQMVTLCFLAPTLLTLAMGFVLFRLLDIVKPFPARRLESLPGGSGIMADDLMAGVYANVLLQVALRVLPS